MKPRFSITVPSTFMYLQPSENSEVTDQLLYGTGLSVSRLDGGDYVYCKTEYGYGGYVDVAAFSETKERTDFEKFIVISDFCPVYGYPEHRYAPKLSLPRGSIIQGKILTRKNGFLEIDTGKESFFVSENHAVQASSIHIPLENEKKRRQIVKTALSYLHSPYMWSGKTAMGIDCSGLCFMAYTLCGVGLYRDAEFDGRYMRKIPFSHIKPADLIYYSGHVTMYIGQSMYIHASASAGKVTINSFNKNSRLFLPKLYGTQLCCASSLFFNES